MEVVTAEPAARPVRKATPIAPSSSFRTGVVAILLVTLIWRYWTMSNWSWFQDDWLYMTKAVELPLGQYLAQNYNGHVMPGQFAIAWAMAHAAPLNYSYAVAVVLGFVTASIIAWAAALRTIFGERVRLLYPLVVLALSPLFMPISLWWAASIQVFPLQLFMGLSILFTARYMIEGRRRADLVGLAASYGGGLFFWEKALLIAVPVAFVAWLLSTGSIRRRISNSKQLLSLVGIITLVYLPIYLLLTRDGDAAGTELFEKRGLGETFAFFVTGFLDVGVPALVGGPWSSPEDPQQLFSAASGVLTLTSLTLLVAGSAMALRIRRSAGLMIAMAVTYAAVSWGLLFTSSRFDVMGVFSVRDARYAADILPVALLTLAFLMTPTRLETGSQWLTRNIPAFTRDALRVGSVVALIGIVASSIIASGRIWDASAPASPKVWVDNLTSDAKAGGAASIYDSMAPNNVIAGWFLNDARLSQLLKPLQLPLSFNDPAPEVYVPDWAGHLKEADIDPAAKSVSPGPVPGCGYLVEEGKTTVIPLDSPMYDWEWGYQFDYFSAGPAALTSRTANEAVELTLGAGLNHVQLVVEDAVDKIVLESHEGSSAVCITEVRVGPVKASERWIGDVSTEGSP